MSLWNDSCPQRGFEFVYFVGILPREPVARSAEVAVGRRRQVDRSAKLQIVNDLAGFEWENFAHGPSDFLGVGIAGAKGLRKNSF